eukprot:TRINITY_DN11090_c0_g1_i1.p1 TRINITY_DN11090_c0_g1~~TRINITY_DN11090_c0_g1_i1.p1  ORF type:complete len:403 (-),score=129.49 TRINITY_DN11090_c0_g1_i1:43-1251(-)
MSNKAADLIRLVFRTIFGGYEFVFINELLNRQTYTSEKELTDSLNLPFKYIKDKLKMIQSAYPFVISAEKRVPIERKEDDKKQYKRLPKTQKIKYFAVSYRIFLNYLSLKITFMEESITKKMSEKTTKYDKQNRSYNCTVCNINFDVHELQMNGMKCKNCNGNNFKENKIYNTENEYSQNVLNFIKIIKLKLKELEGQTIHEFSTESIDNAHIMVAKQEVVVDFVYEGIEVDGLILPPEAVTLEVTERTEKVLEKNTYVSTVPKWIADEKPPEEEIDETGLFSMFEMKNYDNYIPIYDNVQSLSKEDAVYYLRSLKENFDNIDLDDDMEDSDSDNDSDDEQVIEAKYEDVKQPSVKVGNSYYPLSSIDNQIRSLMTREEESDFWIVYSQYFENIQNNFKLLL